MKKRLLITIFTAIALVFALNKSFAQCDFTVTDDEPYFDDYEASENFVCWQTEIVSGTVNQLIVGYRTDKNDAWHTLLNFTEATGDWETVTVALPNPSATYQIVFNGIGHDAEGASPLTFSTFNHII